MLKIYGSKMCPDCRECKRNFDINKIEYEFLDVTESLKHLRDFLILRDSNPVFDRLKAIHDIGLPGIVKEDGEVFTDWESYLKEKGLPIVYEEQGQACSIDHKGC
ncbi:MAG: glutaredoxin [Lachnospiraceae bacterium]|nr:glutaredoxin [Lachnospiraceae bacterium]